MQIFEKLRDKKILLIDDDEWIRDSLSLYFQGEGCHLVSLATAEEAIETLNTGPYEIIISDYRLPGMDGIEFFKLVKESYPRSMKILITAFGNEELSAAAKRVGVEKIIYKPLTAEAIEESLQDLLGDEENRKKNGSNRNH